MKQPVYVLYAGRKANALGLPLSPSVVDAETLDEAFRKHVALPKDMRMLQRALFPAGTDASRAEISHDPCVGFASGLKQLRREVRRDAGANRSRWQFAERTVEVGTQRLHDEETLS